MKKRILLGILVLFVVFVAVSVYAQQIVRLAPLTVGIATSAVTATTTAAVVPTTALAGRESIAIRLTTTTDTVYIGTSAVSSANGWILDSSCPSLTLDLDDSVTLYARTASGTAEVRILEVK